MGEKSQSRERRLETLRDLPPSAKLVFKTLQYEGSLTQEELAEETVLPPRTVRYATTKLEDHQIITSRMSFRDARKRVYSIVPPLRGPDADKGLP